MQSAHGAMSSRMAASATRVSPGRPVRSEHERGRQTDEAQQGIDLFDPWSPWRLVRMRVVRSASPMTDEISAGVSENSPVLSPKPSRSSSPSWWSSVSITLANGVPSGALR